MERSETSGPLFEIVAPLIRGLGFEIVELVGKQRRGMYHANLVIYRESGVDLGDTTTAYKAVYSRLTVALDTEDIHLEVSSPGVYRSLKDAREFSIFIGSRVKVLCDTRDDWVTGTITCASDESVGIEVENELIDFPYGEIRKAQLVYP